MEMQAPVLLGSASQKLQIIRILRINYERFVDLLNLKHVLTAGKENTTCRRGPVLQRFSYMSRSRRLGLRLILLQLKQITVLPLAEWRGKKTLVSVFQLFSAPAYTLTIKAQESRRDKRACTLYLFGSRL